MKKVSKIWTGILIMAMMSVMMGFGAQAAEEAKTAEQTQAAQFLKDTVWEVTGDVTVRDEPDRKSKKTGKLEAGTPVVVSEDEQDGWCKVRNQTVEGYIETSSLQMVNAANAEALKQEFGVNEEFDSMVLEEYEYQKRQKRTTFIWGAVIGVLVVAIFAVGIVSAINGNKAEQNEDNGKGEEKENIENEESVKETGSNQKYVNVEKMDIEEIGEDD